MKFSEMPYQRVDFEELKKSFETLTKGFENASSGEEQFEVHKTLYDLIKDTITNSTLAQIRHNIDMTDEFYTAESDYYDENDPILTSLLVEYQKKFYHSKFRPYLEEKVGHVAFKNMELSMKSIDDKILPLMQEENKLSSQYDKLIASAEIDWHGEVLNLSLLTPYLTNADRAIRIEAWKKYTDFFSANKEALDDIYDKLVKNRTEQAMQLGYENYLPLGYNRMNRNCYGQKEIKSFREQIKRDFVPFAAKLHDRRRKRLGLTALHFEDEGVYFKNGNPNPIGTPAEIMEAGRKMYSELSPETKTFMDFMCDNELFDVLGRKTKKAGGYMTELPKYKAPFVFANFNGTAGDVDVMTHECGHAFQGFLMFDDPILEHSYITMDSAETHSMSMEFFTEPWMKLFFGEREKDYIDMHLESCAAFLPYGTMVDEFQHIMYENPGLSPKARNEAWRDLERQYKPHLDYSGNPYLEQGGFWQKQLHIYNSPLYYIDYCLAQTNAFQYKGWMDRDYKAAWESYLSFCKLGAKEFFTDINKLCGLRSPFEEGSIKAIVSELEKVGL